jgi:restriction endonuclease S subunit
MSDEWKTHKLGDCCDINPSSIKADWPHCSMQYIDISSVGVGIAESPPTRYLKKDAPSRAQRLVAPGDSLLSTVRPNRRSMLWLGNVDDDVVVSTGFAVLRARLGLMEPRFLYYTVFDQWFTDYLVTREKGAAYPAVSAADIADAQILLPPLAEQKAISAVLGALDDRIDLNRRMNATLESMARALFQSWFVDFDPVRAKMEGRQPGGMEAETAALFPASFQESLVGQIPTGWRAAHLGDVIEVFDSKRVPLSGREREQRQGQYPYHGAASVMDYVDDYLFDGVYALMGEDGSVINDSGTPVLQYVWGKFWVNNHAHVLRGKNGVCTEHLLLHLKNSNIAAFVTGAVQPKLNQGNMNRIPFILPSREVSEAFAKTIEPLFAEIRANADQSNTLATLRDTLLPKLLSGELSVLEMNTEEYSAV